MAGRLSCIAFSEDVCKLTNREADRQPGSNSTHPSKAIGRKHAVSRRRSGRRGYKPTPFIKPDSVGAYSAETSKFAAVQNTSFGNGTHTKSLRVRTVPRSSTFPRLSGVDVKGLINAVTGKVDFQVTGNPTTRLSNRVAKRGEDNFRIADHPGVIVLVGTGSV